MRQAMITLGTTCRLYGQFGKKDGLDIIKEDINFEIFNENHKTWWTYNPENNEARKRTDDSKARKRGPEQ